MLSSTSMFVAETHFTEQPSKVATDCCCPCCCWNCDAATTDGSRNGFYRRVAILDCGFLVLSGFFPLFFFIQAHMICDKKWISLTPEDKSFAQDAAGLCHRTRKWEDVCCKCKKGHCVRISRCMLYSFAVYM